MENAKNIEVWKTIYAAGKNDLRYPNDVLIRLGNKLLNPRDHHRILDFGFGTGANLLHFARLGYKMSGVEISPDAIAKTRHRLQAENLEADLHLASPAGILPFSDNYFDSIIAWQVLYYNDWNTFPKMVNELMRTLRKGGVFITTMAAEGDISHTQSKPLGNGVYSSLVPSQEGSVLLIPPKSELPSLFPGMNVEIGEFMHSLFGITGHHWILTFTKE